MASLDVVNEKNEKAGSIDLPAEIFEARVRPHLYHAEVLRQLASRRKGTHSTKNRAAVSGGGAKPYKQKGTGRARQGTTRAPQWAGGGVVFGPVPRGYSFKLPKKMRKAALTSALTQLAKDESIIVVDDLSSSEYKTKAMAGVLDALGLSGQKVLVVTDAANPMLEASLRNIPGVGLVRAEGLNVYDLLRHSKVVMTRGAVASLETRLVPGQSGVDSA
ncbi:MAG: 50S ribosomal protein L4 [Deltaproteobacteria bacterium]|nr:50S ribosomal protein L4 [Deltaproteobacteria bacterium]